MSGDLGNLLTGELGEAEARFSHEDFAVLYGRRIAGRVRRRRAVRAAGVGGGTMLTAGALVVGVTQVPWGTLGATPGVSRSDCVTPSQTPASFAYELVIFPGVTPAATVSLTDPATGAAIFTAIAQPDGSYHFTDVGGKPLEWTSEWTGEGPGSYRVVTSQVLATSPGLLTTDSAGDEIWVESISTVAFANSNRTAPRASDDCITPSPTPSSSPSLSVDYTYTVEPSLAAKLEELDGSPFQCGFVFPTESRETDEISFMSSKWLDPADALLQLPEVPLGSPPLPAEGELGPVAKVTIAMRARPSEVDGGRGWLWTSTDPTDPALVQTQLGAFDNSTMTKVFKSVGFVGVQHGTVVAVPFASADLVDGGWKTSETAVSVAVKADGDGEYPQVYLVDKNSLLEPCPGVTTPVADMDVTAVAGMVVLQPGESTGDTSYGWWPLGTP